MRNVGRWCGKARRNSQLTALSAGTPWSGRHPGEKLVGLCETQGAVRGEIEDLAGLSGGSETPINVCVPLLHLCQVVIKPAFGVLWKQVSGLLKEGDSIIINPVFRERSHVQVKMVAP